MRAARIKEFGASFYHIVSRVVDRRMVLDANEKERFRTLLRAVEAFSGCEVLTWACLDNHWHVCFRGYGEALGGSRMARRGLGKLLGLSQPETAWRPTARAYRKLLYVAGEARGVAETGQPARPGFQAQTVAAVVEADGALPLNELLRCRVRYFTDGAVLGSRVFVEEVFHRHRDLFGARRTRGAHAMVGGDWGDLCTLRRLRLDVMAPAAVAG